MATPRTLVIPPQPSERGGALLTPSLNQGQQAIEQAIVIGLQGHGRTIHPWLQDRPGIVSAIFADSGMSRINIEAHVRSVFARLDALEMARLIGLSIRNEKGIQVVEVTWVNLRLGRDAKPITTRVETRN